MTDILESGSPINTEQNTSRIPLNNTYEFPDNFSFYNCAQLPRSTYDRFVELANFLNPFNHINKTAYVLKIKEPVNIPNIFNWLIGPYDKENRVQALEEFIALYGSEIKNATVIDSLLKSYENCDEEIHDFLRENFTINETQVLRQVIKNFKGLENVIRILEDPKKIELHDYSKDELALELQQLLTTLVIDKSANLALNIEIAKKLGLAELSPANIDAIIDLLTNNGTELNGLEASREVINALSGIKFQYSVSQQTKITEYVYRLIEVLTTDTRNKAAQQLLNGEMLTLDYKSLHKILTTLDNKHEVIPDELAKVLFNLYLNSMKMAASVEKELYKLNTLDEDYISDRQGIIADRDLFNLVKKVCNPSDEYIKEVSAIMSQDYQEYAAASTRIKKEKLQLTQDKALMIACREKNVPAILQLLEEISFIHDPVISKVVFDTLILRNPRELNIGKIELISPTGNIILGNNETFTKELSDLTFNLNNEYVSKAIEDYILGDEPYNSVLTKWYHEKTFRLSDDTIAKLRKKVNGRQNSGYAGSTLKFQALIHPEQASKYLVNYGQKLNFGKDALFKDFASLLNYLDDAPKVANHYLQQFRWKDNTTTQNLLLLLKNKDISSQLKLTKEDREDLFLDILSIYPSKESSDERNKLQKIILGEYNDDEIKEFYDKYKNNTKILDVKYYASEKNFKKLSESINKLEEIDLETLKIIYNSVIAIGSETANLLTLQSTIINLINIVKKDYPQELSEFLNHLLLSAITHKRYGLLEALLTGEFDQQENFAWISGGKYTNEPDNLNNDGMVADFPELNLKNYIDAPDGNIFTDEAKALLFTAASTDEYALRILNNKFKTNPTFKPEAKYKHYNTDKSAQLIEELWFGDIAEAFLTLDNHLGEIKCQLENNKYSSLREFIVKKWQLVNANYANDYIVDQFIDATLPLVQKIKYSGKNMNLRALDNRQAALQIPTLLLKLFYKVDTSFERDVILANKDRIAMYITADYAGDFNKFLQTELQQLDHSLAEELTTNSRIAAINKLLVETFIKPEVFTSSTNCNLNYESNLKDDSKLSNVDKYNVLKLVATGKLKTTLESKLGSSTYQELYSKFNRRNAIIITSLLLLLNKIFSREEPKNDSKQQKEAASKEQCEIECVKVESTNIPITFFSDASKEKRRKNSVYDYLQREAPKELCI